MNRYNLAMAIKRSDIAHTNNLDLQECYALADEITIDLENKAMALGERIQKMRIEAVDLLREYILSCGKGGSITFFTEFDTGEDNHHDLPCGFYYSDKVGIQEGRIEGIFLADGKVKIDFMSEEAYPLEIVATEDARYTNYENLCAILQTLEQHCKLGETFDYFYSGPKTY